MAITRLKVTIILFIGFFEKKAFTVKLRNIYITSVMYMLQNLKVSHFFSFLNILIAREQ